VAGVDGLFDAGDLGLGTYGSSGSFSEHLSMTSKGMDSGSMVSPPAIPPTEDEGYLWMAPWSGASGPL